MNLFRLPAWTLVLAFGFGSSAPAFAVDPGCPSYLLGGHLEHNPLVASDQRIPWTRIEASHFVPALKHELEAFRKRFAEILANPEAPTFENTVLAVEFASEKIARLARVFSVYTNNHNTPAFQAVQYEVGALENDYYDLLMQSEAYFQRVSQVMGQLREGTEEHAITRGIHEEFLERGALLDPAKKIELAGIHRRLSQLSDQFDLNATVQENSVRIRVDHLEDLAGLPERWLEMVRQTRDEQGRWWIHLKNGSLVRQVLENVESEAIRKKVYFGESARTVARNHITREEAGQAWKVDNRPVLLEILALRQRLAAILGNESYAHGVLKDRMAAGVEQVRKFYEELLPGVKELARREQEELLQFARSMDPTIQKLEPWDRVRFVKKLYEQKYRLNQDRISEYFEVRHTLDSVFDFYGDLFGIRFERIPGAESWLPEVEVYRIHDLSTGTVLSELHLDLFTRDTKTGGAWKASIQKAGLGPNGRQSSVMEVTMNLDRAPEGEPTLLRIGEVNTLFHELGHAMHEAFSATKYQPLAGTSVVRDFVEFPSQIMENWLYTPEFLARGARHHRTGESLPAEWIQRIRDAENFRIGTQTRGQMMFGLLDFHWHSSLEDFAGARAKAVDAFEKGIYDRYGIERLQEYSPISPAFGHIFSGGYAMGYYSYLWGNMIEADGFEYWYSDSARIKEKAIALKNLLLSQGGARDPNELYRAWTGRDYSPKPFLRRIGL